MRILFAGTPEVAVPTLKALHASAHTVVGVLTQPDAPGKRGRKLLESPVALAAHELGIEVLKAPSARTSDVREWVEGRGADAAAVVAYGNILPPRLLETVPGGFFNLHFSLLPRYRGAAPVQRAIEAGERTTGVSVFRLDEGLDMGPIARQLEVEIHEAETSGELLERLSHLGAPLVLEAMDALEAGTLDLTHQAEDGVSYAPKLTLEQARIDFSRTAPAVAQHIRAFSPNPGAYTTLDGQRIKILGAREAGDGVPEAAAGTLHITKKSVFVNCARGAVEITLAQPAGKKAMAATDWARGARLSTGATFDTMDEAR